MATIEDLKGWIEHDFGRRSSADKKVQDITQEWLRKNPTEYPYHRIKIYTFTNCYIISATERPDGGYLGCIAQSRKPRAGEDWTRGNDLPDGKLDKETWNSILRGIICYELEDVFKSERRTFEFDQGKVNVEIDDDALEDLKNKNIDAWSEVEEGIKKGLDAPLD